MSDAINEINTFVEQLAVVPTIMANFVSGMPTWFQFAVGLTVVLGVVVIIWRLIS